MRPGRSTVVHAQLVGNPLRFDDVLLQLPVLLADLAVLGVRRWWVRRYRDLIHVGTDQHIAIFLRLDGPDRYGPVAAQIADLAAHLHEQGLPGHLVLAPYTPQPARYGRGGAMEAAEHVFAADTTTATTQVALARRADVPAQALAAASMADLASAFATDPVAGYQALLDCLHRGSGRVDRSLSDQARQLANPDGDFAALRGLPAGDAVAAAWRCRANALRAYHDTLAEQRNPTTVLRTLLHEHHNRAVGVDPTVETTTGHLARSAALRCLAWTSTL
jgi:thiopeptide-type bacteriocin biosynthesis protein